MTTPDDAHTVAQALDLFADGLDDTAVGAVVGRPVLLLDLDRPSTPDDRARLRDVLAGAPVVVVGWASTPFDDDTVLELLDVALTTQPHAIAPWVVCDDIDTIVQHLVVEVDRSSAAAVALVQLLRLAATSTPVEAVVAESFVYSLLQGGDRHREWLASRAARERRPRPDHPVVRVERDGADLEVVLDRPEVRNAYGTRMRDELVEALRLVAVDPTIERVVVRGNGPAFSSGGDLDEFGTAPTPLAAHLVRTTRNAGIALASVADRVTMRVHGPCVGAGVELPAFASRVVADPATTFLLPEVSMGLIPGAGGTSSIPRRIGRHRTAFLALHGRPLDASTALDWGLVDELAPIAASPQWVHWRRTVDLDEYEARFDRVAADGGNPHGEVDFLERFAPRSVLDAGCGFGRIAIELRRRGVDAVGVDLDADLLERARRRAPDMTWHLADLVTFDADRAFDLVVAAGNVFGFVDPSFRADALRSCARHVAPGGHLVVGNGLSARWPTVDDYEQWAAAAGLTAVDRFAGWDGTPFTDGGDYVVGVWSRPA